MQQERDNRGGVEEMKQNQDRRLKPTQLENIQQPALPPPQQPQKCPRCESLNTKFCYYNNYSLSQPRYFCKTCRRYWTQGGTLRNVPVGGGCRKGKRTKTSSSSSAENSNSLSHPQQLSQQKTHQNLTTASAPMVSNTALPEIPSVASLYPGGGFLSSLAAIQSLNQPQSFNQNLSDNFGLLQGFNVPSFSSQQHQKIQQGQFYQIDDNRDHKNIEALHPSDQEEGLNIQHDWNQSFVNNSIPTVSDATFWSINGGAAGNAAGSSMNPNQWPDLPGYGAPP